jgi:hypothetical protein
VRLDRADCICTAARVEPASLAEERAHEVAIALDREDEQTTDDRRARGGRHRDGADRASAASRSVASCAPHDAAAAGNTRTTTRAPGGNVASRAAIRCRSWRRTRLRSTAPPTDRPTTNPARGASKGDGDEGAASKRWTTRRGEAARRPDRAAAAKSERCRSRDAAGSMRDPERRATSGRKALTALPTTRRKDGAAGASAHPQPESMGLCAPTIVRLERTLAHSRAPGRGI